MEEIIIDSVDAHECEFYCNGFCDCHTKKHTASCDNKMQYKERIACGHYPNCYYKQLKQKEKEIEELHERTAKIIHRITGGRLSYSTYTFEAVERAYYDQLEIDVEKKTKELERENEQLKEQLQFKNQFRDYAHKYKQAIDKIKEICNKEEAIFCRTYKKDCNKCPQNEYCFGRKILQIINEVEE